MIDLVAEMPFEKWHGVLALQEIMACKEWPYNKSFQESDKNRSRNNHCMVGQVRNAASAI